MRAEVSRAIRAVLADVVAEGTAQRVRGAFLGAGGEPVVTGGKTGSGDNRYVLVARGGKKIGSRATSRTAAFVFYIGERYFGVVTASVMGEKAAEYRFTSSLPLAVLKLLAPAVSERLSPRPPPAAPRRLPGAAAAV